MSKFKFYVLGNFSPNIRTFGKCRCTCYFLKGFSKSIFLDFGAGVFKKFYELLKKKEIDLENIIIIISHNHVDHNFAILSLGAFLKAYNFKNKSSVKIHIYLPQKSIMFKIISTFKSVFNIHILNENTNIIIDKANISFCKTIHKGESYATKIQMKDNIFVYTSDIARYSKSLEEFVKNSNAVLIDAGYPKKLLNSFKNYHGRTKQILGETSKLGIGVIYATHIRFFSKKEDYIENFPNGQTIYLVKINNEYDMFPKK